MIIFLHCKDFSMMGPWWVHFLSWSFMWCRHFWSSSKLQENDRKPTLKINNWSSSKYQHQNMWCFNTWIGTMQFITSWFMFSFSWLNRARRRYARDLCDTVNELKQEIHELKVKCYMHFCSAIILQSAYKIFTSNSGHFCVI